MPNIRQNHIPSSYPSENFTLEADGSLDTLAQPRKALDKRAKSKHFTGKLAIALADLGGDLEKYYRNAFYCNHTLTQVGTKITGKYCNTRICNTCNRIRMANMINGYGPVLQELKDLQFVTLTIPNIPGEELPGAITAMGKSFVKVMDRLRKRSISYGGIRKLEITYNTVRNDFHPHYHLIVSGAVVAKTIVDEWLLLNPTAKIYGQNIRPVDANSLKELFKYTAKVVSVVNGKQIILVKVVDTIMRALYKRRIVQPFGYIKKYIEEDIDELQSDTYDIPYYENMEWRWEGEDWCNEYGELLTGYTPSDTVRDLIIDSG